MFQPRPGLGLHPGYPVHPRYEVSMAVFASDSVFRKAVKGGVMQKYFALIALGFGVVAVSWLNIDIKQVAAQTSLRPQF